MGIIMLPQVEIRVERDGTFSGEPYSDPNWFRKRADAAMSGAQQRGDPNPTPQYSDDAGTNWLNVAAGEAAIFGEATRLSVEGPKPRYTGPKEWASAKILNKAY